MKLYELCCGDRDVRFSPFVWRIIMCLHHKGLSFERFAMTFLEAKDVLTTDPQTVPVLEDGDRQIVDSFEIAKYLDENYPDKPLFEAGEDIERYKDLNLWTDRTVCLGIFKMLAKDICDVQDEDNAVYFRKNREARLGRSLEDIHEARDSLLDGFRASLEPLRERLADGKFLSGPAPAWFDYCVFGTFQWARIASNYELLEENDILFGWRARMLDLFDGYAGKAKLAYA